MTASVLKQDPNTKRFKRTLIHKNNRVNKDTYRTLIHKNNRVNKDVYRTLIHKTIGSTKMYTERLFTKQ